MSRLVSNILHPLVINSAASAILLEYYREKERETIELLHKLAVATLEDNNLRSKAQIQLGRLLEIRDMIFELDKSKT